MLRGVIAVALIASLCQARDASAQRFPDITDRDFALDLYNGSALGSLQMVGMGGVAVALVQGSSGMLVNPAAVGVRSPTSTGRWDWDVHLDWLNPGLGVDRDNNGLDDIPDDDGRADVQLSPLIYGGGAILYKQFALGVAITATTITSEVGSIAIDQDVSQGQIHFAASLWRNQLVVGAGLRIGGFQLENRRDEMDDPVLFSSTTTAFETGAVWMPAEQNVRVGAAATLPFGGTTPTVEGGCDPNNCFGLILPNELEVPWSVSAGVGLKLLTDDRWNRKVHGKKWIDERYLLLGADVVVTGSVNEGVGVEAFSRTQRQVSGDRTVLSVRAGAEYEWIPGRLRVRAGSYYEPSRFRDAVGDAVPGRVHATAGLDVRVWQFRLWRWDYRLRISLIADLARDYANGGLSIGFWR